ncbi:DUF1761 domain-containing protein [Pseudoalteromonas piscicida]|uniref:DUF1761 domain-containing protein n=1 Tax=Pseudoalteromonas piscicida TaxID=43662 RepID=A0AAQ2EPR7_PSEO7|nr:MULTISPECIES: DUF1761 domain-containing protein [Pseudoalteromonas]KJY86132.1 hypothetical protein TW75_18065 [Pseudoalteromonas piscicida]MDP4486336.1 DUF1761 domain-containing protein [Pseudoalteromonas piscicida]TMN35419.1 DUF1761 domain-containing protein [Pseudoalteromonas piscicida]TMN37970.1 DUF1761 domain-containing protein [Pseudoalteromonas piscicida]TMN47135.1 DUF1761 domain-containing protein [Pseudoalteromonas piscicida]
MIISFEALNLWAIILAALSSFMLGGIWYSPMLFQKAWMEGCGLTELDLQTSDPKMTFGVAFLLSLLSAVFMAVMLDLSLSLLAATGVGLGVGVFFVACSLGISYIFEQRPMKLFLVNGGYHVLQFTLIAFVLRIMS